MVIESNDSFFFFINIIKDVEPRLKVVPGFK